MHHRKEIQDFNPALAFIVNRINTYTNQSFVATVLRGDSSSYSKELFVATVLREFKNMLISPETMLKGEISIFLNLRFVLG